MGVVMKDKKVLDITKSSKNLDKGLIDEKAVEKLAHILNDTNLTEIEYEAQNCRIRVARTPAPIAVAQAHAPIPLAMANAVPAAPRADDSGVSHDMDFASHPGAVKSPMVGTVWLSSLPDVPAFISEGDTIKEGDTLLIIEAMKVMNPIRAPKSGKVAKVLVKNAEPVEYDHPLVIIT